MQAEPDGSWWERSAGRLVDELAAANDGAGAAFPAGRSFHYSNLGYALLGEVVGPAARARPGGRRPATRILEPLGMTAHVVPARGAARRRAGACTPTPAR